MTPCNVAMACNGGARIFAAGDGEGGGGERVGGLIGADQRHAEVVADAGVIDAQLLVKAVDAGFDKAQGFARCAGREDLRPRARAAVSAAVVKGSGPSRLMIAVWPGASRRSNRAAWP